MGVGGAVQALRRSSIAIALLDELQAVDVDSLVPEGLGAELKFIRASVDLLELQAARRVAAFDRGEAFYELGEQRRSAGGSIIRKSRKVATVSSGMRAAASSWSRHPVPSYTPIAGGAE